MLKSLYLKPTKSTELKISLEMKGVQTDLTDDEFRESTKLIMPRLIA